jgi:hypothetical protein
VHSGQGQKGGRNREGRTLWTGSRGQRMAEHERKIGAFQECPDYVGF